MFHAVPLATDVNAAKVLAFSYPELQDGILSAGSRDDQHDRCHRGRAWTRTHEAIAFALDDPATRQHRGCHVRARCPPSPSGPGQN